MSCAEDWRRCIEKNLNDELVEINGGFTTKTLLPFLNFKHDKKPLGLFETREECEEFIKYRKEHPFPLISF